jgi:phage RecT family recombinase
MTKQLTVHQTAIQKLNHPKMVESIKAVLPAGMSADRYLAIAAAEIKSPNLSKIQDANSILLSIFHAAKLGLSLNPHMKEAYLVPYNCKQKDGSKKFIAQFIPGYQGLAKLVRQAENNGISVKDIKGFCVHDTDEFDYSVDGINGLTVNFKPNLLEKPNSRIAAFSMAMFSDSYISYHVVPGYKVEEIKKKALYKTRGSGPWKDNEDEMWEKTAIRHHCKTLPKSEGVSMAVAQDEIFEGKPLSSDIPEELASTGLIDEAEYEDLVEEHNEADSDNSSKPITEAPQSKTRNRVTKVPEEPKNINEELPFDYEPKDKRAAFLKKLFSIVQKRKLKVNVDEILFAEFGKVSAGLDETDFDAAIKHFENM